MGLFSVLKVLLYENGVGEPVLSVSLPVRSPAGLPRPWDPRRGRGIRPVFFLPVLFYFAWISQIFSSVLNRVWTLGAEQCPIKNHS